MGFASPQQTKAPGANCSGVVILCRRVRYSTVDLRTDLPSIQRLTPHYEVEH